MTREDPRAWIGRCEEVADRIEPGPIARLFALLDKPRDVRLGDLVPPGGHWLYFLPLAPQADLAEDGHPRRGGFLPPVDLPRRMWAGGRLAFHEPLRIGDALVRISTIKDVTLKEGRSGRLCFVTVEHAIAGPRGVSIVEAHDIVYREAPRPGVPASVPKPAPQGDWRRQITPTAVLLFRYSALTFNGHRIHYDRSYVTEVEGYPGLVVHGPLQATLLLDLIGEQAGAPLKSFSFRALHPVFDLMPFAIHGRNNGGSAALWVADHQGALCMEAEASW